MCGCVCVLCSVLATTKQTAEFYRNCSEHPDNNSYWSTGMVFGSGMHQQQNVQTAFSRKHTKLKKIAITTRQIINNGFVHFIHIYFFSLCPECPKSKMYRTNSYVFRLNAFWLWVTFAICKLFRYVCLSVYRFLLACESLSLSLSLSFYVCMCMCVCIALWVSCTTRVQEWHT